MGHSDPHIDRIGADFTNLSSPAPAEVPTPADNLGPVDIVPPSDMSTGIVGATGELAPIVSREPNTRVIQLLSNITVPSEHSETRAALQRQEAKLADMQRDIATLTHARDSGGPSDKDDVDSCNSMGNGDTNANRAVAGDTDRRSAAATPSGSEAVNREVKLQSLQPAERKAYFSFVYAEQRAGRKLHDREAYDWLKENGLPDGVDNLAEVTDYELPTFETWNRQLRVARSALGEQKYNRRSGRPTGRSIATVDEV